MEVGDVNAVKVDEAEASHTRRGEVRGRRSAEAARADDEHGAVGKPGLPFGAKLGQGRLTEVTSCHPNACHPAPRRRRGIPC
jgi:hypothetical protein